MYLPALFLKDIWVVSWFWLLCNGTSWACLLVNLCMHFSGTHLHVELIGHKIGECSAFRDVTGLPMWLCQLLSHHKGTKVHWEQHFCFTDLREKTLQSHLYIQFNKMYLSSTCYIPGTCLLLWSLCSSWGRKIIWRLRYNCDKFYRQR